ncbi:hydroxypyruvate isomerase family protein [Motiliproteus sp. SC1-56]|uniref:hydroxypyruvate isomerase family protein n=1 Tax=Motiliproteus sp. SC1-56 TaxID=2799565 RepID=UPI001A90158C|nr:hydroxypyruvate isomerase family protein [Motiliproteus sp. SC1-56]
MPRFCPNLSLLFTEHPWPQRFSAAATAGFDAVEIQFPYQMPPALLADRLRQHQLELVLINFPAGDWSRGERGIACDPLRQAEFQAGVAQALSYAEATGCRQINCLAGIPPCGLSPRAALDCLKENLAYAAAQCAPQGVTVLVEAINTQDIPGFLLHRTDTVIELLVQVDAPNLALQYDVYHMQIMETDLFKQLKSVLPHTAHIQIADVPGRHEPGTGTLDFPRLFSQLDALGYTGWVGLEYLPRSGTQQSLDWLAPGLRSNHPHLSRNRESWQPSN